EFTVVSDRDTQWKRGDLRMAILDAKLRQRDELTIGVVDWRSLKFKKGTNKFKSTLTTIQLPFLEGEEYYLAVTLIDRRNDHRITLRLVKFKVGKEAP